MLINSHNIINTKSTDVRSGPISNLRVTAHDWTQITDWTQTTDISIDRFKGVETHSNKKTRKYLSNF